MLTNYNLIGGIMPRFNKKGPDGEGPRTGRGAGDCKPSSNKDQRNSLPARLGRRAMERIRRPLRRKS